MTRTIRILLPLFFAAVLLAFPAFAQNTLRLDAEGNWVPVETEIDPSSDEGVMNRARKQLAENRPRGALALLDSWIKRNAAQDKPETAEALLRRGDAKLALKDEYEALYDYERVIKEYPGTPQFVTALERELEIGLMYLNGLRKKSWGLRIDNASRIGEELLIRVQERAPGSQLAQRAAIELANYYYRIRDLRMAAEAYDIFLANFPTSEYRELAMERRVFANIGRYKGPRYDASGLIEAQYLVRDFAARYPKSAEQIGMNDALIARLDESAADQMFETGKWYFKRDDPISARYTLKRLLQKHPDTVAADETRLIFKQRNWPLPPARTKPPVEDDDPSDQPVTSSDVEGMLKVGDERPPLNPDSAIRSDSPSTPPIAPPQENRE
ncbi:MAG: outer membrane protein assembly factor BamD [Phycisphaerae bacterium]|nr:outer membrane protein assembly factor BamD [Phycisphaerae bacterium]MBN8598235.1 outer membrane protein assembly factor BamD [Planctomycetota bacterium]